MNTLGNSFSRTQIKSKSRVFQVLQDCGNTSTAKIDCTNATESQPGETYIILSDNSGTQAATIQEPNCDIQNILQNQSILFDITNQIIENQKKIIHKLASISVQMEDSFSKIENLNTKTVSLKDASSAETDSFILKQIKNVKDLEQMEQLLSDKDYKKKLKNSCLFICSSGEGHGTNCAYRFLDVLFSRDFLCECSWSGSCRDDYVKISLKCFKNTLNFFFEMINHWDTSYTQETNETFFKNILKNAKKRKSVKYERIPTKRNRLKGVKSAKKQKTTDTSNIIEGIGTETINIPVIDDQPANDTTEGSANIERVRDNEEEEEDYLC